MFTKRLYDENSYIREFDARVLSVKRVRTAMRWFWMNPLFSRRAADSLRIRVS